MNINESGFVNISSITDEKIVVGKNKHVVIFDDSNNVKNIILEENARVDYFGYFSGNDRYEKHIITTGKNSDANVNCFLLSKGEEKLTAKIFGEVAVSHSKIDTDIIALVMNGGDIDIDGVIQIDQGVEKVEGYLDETNIFLGEKGKVRGFPTLLVRSNDVKAGHGCNIEKISDEKLFYLRSRGLEKESALVMMVQSYIETIFGDLENIDEPFHNDLVDTILQKIQ